MSSSNLAQKETINQSKVVEEEFNFPFQPYAIQIELMRAAYDAYENSKFALLESPTGTGKSLSLICSALTWLRNYQASYKRKLEEKKSEIEIQIQELKRDEDKSDDWISVQTNRQDVTRDLSKIQEELERLLKFEKRDEARRHARVHGTTLTDYEAFSDRPKEENQRVSCEETADSKLIISQTSDQSEDDGADLDEKVVPQDEDCIRPKIFYASRTHSQLSQFIREVKKTKFASTESSSIPVKVALLASRANLCVNPDVLKLRDSSAINEKCMELQRESKPENRCPYAKVKQVNMLKEHILTTVHDIEDLVSRGRAIGSCPYYASRMAISEAELVVLPYNNLLHRETRQASSLDLRDNIVIVDEAHNILETICSIHSAPITGLQLIGSHTIFSRYFQKYHSRMSPRNAGLVKSIVQCLTALIKYLDNPSNYVKDYNCQKTVDLEDGEHIVDGNNSENKLATSNSAKSTDKQAEFMIDVRKFISISRIDRFNVFRILDYLNRSLLPRKLLGLFRIDNTIDLSLELHGLSKEEDKSNKNGKSPDKKRRKTLESKRVSSNQRATGQSWEFTCIKQLKQRNVFIDKRPFIINSYPIYTFVEFLKALTSPTGDGKILTNQCSGDILRSCLKFILLNPSSQFKQMTEEARSIVLAGGTMQPFEEYVDLLFEPLGIERSRLSFFSCGHVIDPNNLYVTSLAYGKTGKPLELNYKSRSNFEVIDDIGQTILDISLVAPGGMVCFVPSYDYEQICYNRWVQTGLISSIETRAKRVFREPKQTSHLKPIFEEYSKAIERGSQTGRGALLLCVVGGKMSEGINFNDDLGRCIVMIGLPYANIKSSELQQKMSYYDQTCRKSVGIGSSNQGQKYYENLCIRGINQSIGRAIRHKNDYAAIILIDRRYSSKASIREGLPGWIRSSLRDNASSSETVYAVKAFFNQSRPSQLL